VALYESEKAGAESEETVRGLLLYNRCDSSFVCWESYIRDRSRVPSCRLERGGLFWIIKCMKVVGA